MPNIDRISMRHPDLPGEFVVVPRSTFDKSYSKNGWVEAKSSAAKAAVEEQTSPKADAPTTSKED